MYKATELTENASIHSSNILPLLYFLLLYTMTGVTICHLALWQVSSHFYDVPRRRGILENMVQ